MIQKIKNLFWHLPKSILSNVKYQFPSRKLTLIGITGTDGKTTTCTLLYNVLKEAGYKTGVITTIGAKYGDNTEIDTGLHTTSPDSSIVQRILKQMHKDGVTHVVCEVTAHALDQYRFFGCKFKISGITNIAHEHLDYYKSMEEYTASKTKLFQQSEISVLNKDDNSYNYICNNTLSQIITYSQKNKADFQAKNISIDNKGIAFTVNNINFQTDTPYNYQINNILLALAVSNKLGIDDKIFQKVIKKFPETKGRREDVSNDLKIKTIIDFAHTPQAIQKTLQSLKEITKGNLIIIFGATGGRDKTKRPIMGEIATKYANLTIITSDDTRNENIEDINSQIISGINKKKYFEIDKNTSKIPKEKHSYINIENRQDAFNFAISIAKPGDTVIACGKGHETSILHGTVEYPWSEAEAFRTAFRLKTQQKNG